MKTPLLAAVVAALPLAAWAVQGKSVSDRIDLAPGKELRIVVNTADLVLEPSSSTIASYQIDFVAGSYGIFSSGPSQKAYDASTAVYDRKTGVLSVHAEKDLVARARIFVPEGAALSLTVTDGKAAIRARSGKTAAELANGLLSFDSSKSSCWTASVDSGIARGRSSRPCGNPVATIHLKNGILTVD